MLELSIKLSIEEVNALLSVLGQLPNSSGTYPLLVKIKEQGVAQVSSAEASSPSILDKP